MYKMHKGYYKMDELNQFIEDTADFEVIEKRGVRYANVPCSFDIETTSFYDGDEKRAIMYVWQFGLNGRVIIGRTWMEFHTLINRIIVFHGLDEGHAYLICYVHNLPYEWQWIFRRFEWLDVFFKDARKPLYAKTEGFLFKCSYALTNMSLESVGKNLIKYPVEKLKGFLDYTVIRTPLTPLTDKEIQYCVNDVQVVMSCIQEKIETDGDILHIPLTNTGYVRQYCRSKTLYREDKGKQNRYNKSYRDLIKSLTLTPETYSMARRAFQGGFTHANARNADKVIENVHSIDFTSSYPYVMCTGFYPMTSPEKVENAGYEQIDALSKKYNLIFDIAFTEIESKPDVYDHYISSSKCALLKGKYDKDGALLEPVIVDNGRVAYAHALVMTITEVDLTIIKRFYNFESAKVRNVYKMVKSRLPKEFINAILKLYGDKTELKGVKGKEVEYLVSKGMCNSTYGASVTNPLNDIIEFNLDSDEVYHKEPCDTEKELNKYNNSKKRFLYYMWGVYITAYARYNLCMSIPIFGSDYIYSDTDSIKFTNIEKHMGFIKAYNNNVRRNILNACKELDIDPEKFSPKTIKGEAKTLGVWEWETEKEPYARFKTLGAKRYLYQQSDGLHITVSGVNKSSGAKYLEKFDNPFDTFNNNLKIPAEHSGRMVSTYIDTPTSGVVIDKNGVAYHYHELSSVHMEATTYVFSISEQYINYIRGLREET